MLTRFGELDDASPLAMGIRAYFPEVEWTNAAEIAHLESRWNPWAVNDSAVAVLRGLPGPSPVNGIPSSPELSVGCFQINVLVHYYAEWPTLFDAHINAWAAERVWRSSGSWRPWFHSARALGLI